MPEHAQRESCSAPAVIRFEMSLNVLVGHYGSHDSNSKTFVPFIFAHTLETPTEEGRMKGRGGKWLPERMGEGSVHRFVGE